MPARRGAGGASVTTRSSPRSLPARPSPVPQDNLIIGAVVAACTLFILIYWWRK